MTHETQPHMSTSSSQITVIKLASNFTHSLRYIQFSQKTATCFFIYGCEILPDHLFSKLCFNSFHFMVFLGSINVYSLSLDLANVCKKFKLFMRSSLKSSLNLMWLGIIFISYMSFFELNLKRDRIFKFEILVFESKYTNQ